MTDYNNDQMNKLQRPLNEGKLAKKQFSGISNEQLKPLSLPIQWISVSRHSKKTGEAFKATRSENAVKKNDN